MKNFPNPLRSHRAARSNSACRPAHRLPLVTPTAPSTPLAPAPASESLPFIATLPPLPQLDRSLLVARAPQSP